MSGSTLDRVATIVFVIACVSVVGFVGYRQLAPTSTELVNYSAGDAMEPAVLKQLAGGRPALILNLRSTCDYCTMSMPQLRELVRTSGLRWPDVSIAVASSEPDGAFLGYLKDHELEFSSRVQLQDSGTRLERMVVPSLIVVDEDGTVRHSWLGALVPSRLSEVLEALNTLAPARTAEMN